MCQSILGCHRIGRQRFRHHLRIATTTEKAVTPPQPVGSVDFCIRCSPITAVGASYSATTCGLGL